MTASEKLSLQPSVVVHACNSCTLHTGAGELRVQGLSGLCNKFMGCLDYILRLYLKKKRKKKLIRKKEIKLLS